MLKKFKKRINSKLGVTLVETVVTLVIMMVIIAFTGSLILSSFSTYGRSIRSDAAKQLANQTFDVYMERISAAKRVGAYPMGAALSEIRPEGESEAGYIEGEIFAVANSDGHIYLVNSDGSIHDYFGDGYGNHYINVFVKTSNGYTADFRIDVLVDGEVIYTKESSIRLITLEKKSRKVRGLTVGSDYIDCEKIIYIS